MKDKYITQSTILKERLWTKGLLKKYLPNPHKIKPNPHYKSSSPTKLYLLDAVIAIETNENFKNDFLKMDKKRKILSKKAKDRAEEQRKKLLNYIASIKIEIPKLEKNELLSIACNHYNDLWEQRECYEKRATLKDDLQFLNRISVNYLRHVETKYDEEINRLFGKVGKDLAYIKLKKMILNKIANLYPDLALEVNNQLNRLKEEEFMRLSLTKEYN